jgi:phenylacetate-CoA ligase
LKVADQLFVAAHLIAAMRSQWWSAEVIRARQQAALVDMLRHAATHVPFYRELGLRAADIHDVQALRHFPLIRKRDIQRQPQAFMAEGFARADLFASRTSGSSGEPTTTWFDREAWLLGKYVLKMRRVAATGGLPLFRRVAIVSELAPQELAAAVGQAPSGLGLFFRQHYLSIHAPPAEHLTQLARFRPHLLYAFPSYLLDLATTAERCGQELPRIATIYTSSEVLTPWARARIEAAFHARVYDVYGSTEFKEVAWQCGAGRYHINCESVFLEPAPAGASAAVVLTTLNNRAMPLIRFDVGDRARFATQRCPCGRASPQLAQIEGREGDMITLPSGRRISPYLLTTAIEVDPSILQYQIVQTAAGAFRVDVVRGPHGAQQDAPLRMRAELARILAEPVELAVCEVADLARAASGKRAVFRRAAAASA